MSNGNPKRLVFYSTDKEIIEKLTSRMGLTKEVWLSKPSDGTSLDCWANSLYSDHARRIHSLGMRSNKDDLSIPECDFYPFLRGLLDGDGSLRFSPRVSLEFLGRPPLMLQIAERLLDFSPVISEDTRGRSLKTLGFYGIEKVQPLVSLLYSGASLFMDRKYRVARLILSQVVGS